jgi:predicted Na+-dependent transporter
MHFMPMLFMTCLPHAPDRSLKTQLFDTYIKTMDVVTNLFPLWTVLFTAIALKRPSSFDWFTTEYFTVALAALMLSMGITLTPAGAPALHTVLSREPVSVHCLDCVVGVFIKDNLSQIHGHP